MPSPSTTPGTKLRLLVGSSNLHKVEEVASLLSGATTRSGAALDIVGARELPPGPEIDEHGDTFAANARIKALAYAERALCLPLETRPRWVLADDSGLAVDALDGAPGVRSARYAGTGATDAENNRKLLQALEAVPRERRGARFVCALSLVSVPCAAGGSPLEIASAEGDCRGEVLLEGRGTAGFGYDPLFLVPGLARTYAEISPAEKNALSHRGKALRALRQTISTLDAKD